MKCTLISVQKNYCWIWIAVDRMGKRFVNCEIGSRGTKTGEKLWQKIQSFIKGVVCTDHWQAYNEFVPKDKFIQSKAKTFTVEGYNSEIRHFLARLRRKTKCYSKYPKMLLLSLKLLMLKRNN